MVDKIFFRDPFKKNNIFHNTLFLHRKCGEATKISLYLLF